MSNQSDSCTPTTKSWFCGLKNGKSGIKNGQCICDLSCQNVHCSFIQLNWWNVQLPNKLQLLNTSPIWITIGPLNRWTNKVSKCLTQMAEQLIKIFNLHGYLNDWTTLGKFCISGLSMEYIPIVFKLNILATTGTYIVGNIKATTQLYTFLQLVSRNSWSSFSQDATCSSHFKTKQRKKKIKKDQ